MARTNAYLCSTPTGRPPRGPVGSCKPCRRAAHLATEWDDRAIHVVCSSRRHGAYGAKRPLPEQRGDPSRRHRRQVLGHSAIPGGTDSRHAWRAPAKLDQAAGPLVSAMIPRWIPTRSPSRSAHSRTPSARMASPFSRSRGSARSRRPCTLQKFGNIIAPERASPRLIVAGKSAYLRPPESGLTYFVEKYGWRFS